MWTLEQQRFLEEFYQGVTDPDMKISLLISELGLEDPGNFYVFVAKDPQELQMSDLQTPVSTKIAILEYEVLVQKNLLKPDYC